MTIDFTNHIVSPGRGERLRWRGPAAGGVTILVDPVNTGETGLCVLTQTLDPGAVVPVHQHEKAEQVIFVVSGNGRISLGDQNVRAGPETTVHVPKGVAHGLVNTGDEPFTFLEVTSPPGFQEIFREMHRLGEPTLDDVVRIGSRHDVSIHAGDAS